MSQIAFVSGASGQIGSEIARALKAGGYELYLQGNTNKKALNALCKELAAVPLFCDLSSPQDVKAMFSNIKKLDLCVCCAGAAQVGLFASLSDEQVQSCLGANLSSAVYTSREAVRIMTPAHSGNLIFVSSMWGVVGASCEALYAATKGALVTLSRSLAKEVGPSGIRVNCVAPGLIDTKMNDNLTQAEKMSVVDDTPLLRMGTPLDVANAVVFLASEGASFITGQTILVDGGLTL